MLEHLEGETLAARLARGLLPLDQALTIGIQICDALDRAHRQGIVHRDLKPGNVMLAARSGSAPHAKLLDFGLAKSVRASPIATGGTIGVTAMTPLTAQGTLLGTLQYMSPEQVEGREADARSDIFAVGAVLHEMISGQRAFDGKSPASVIAAILERTPPPLSTLQTLSPPALDHVVARCLAKDRDDRWQNAGDVMRELKWIASTLAAAPLRYPASRLSARLWMGLTLALILALGVFAITRPGPSSEPVFHPVHSALLPPPDVTWSAPFSISPDGRQLVFVGRGDSQGPRLWLYSFDTGETRPLEGTDRGTGPFWSADGRNIGFFVPGQLKRVALEGGPAHTVCPLGQGGGGAWNRNDVILFNDLDNGLFRVAASGGTPVQLKASRIGWPVFLPDGHRFLYVERDGEQEGGRRRTLYAADLDAPEGQQVSEVGSNVAFAPPGFLLFMRGRTLVAQPYDAGRMKTTGDPQPLASDVGFNPAGARGAFSVSAAGVLVYRRVLPEQSELVWLNRDGKRLDVLGPPARYADPVLSPDDKIVAFTVEDGPTGAIDIWLADLDRRVPEQFTRGAGRSRYSAPVWSPNGDRIVFRSESPSGLHVKPLDGKEQQLVAGSMIPGAWSPDGDILVVRRRRTSGIFKVPASGGADPATVIDDDLVHEESPALSHDGRWLAYHSDQTGRNEVYARRADGSGRPVPISSGPGGGVHPRWRPDGRELFYLTVRPDSALMAVDIQAGETLVVGKPARLFQVRTGAGESPDRPRYTVTRDGRRFLVVSSLRDHDALPLTVVHNWLAMMGRKDQ